MGPHRSRGILQTLLPSPSIPILPQVLEKDHNKAAVSGLAEEGEGTERALVSSVLTAAPPTPIPSPHPHSGLGFHRQSSGLGPGCQRVRSYRGHVVSWEGSEFLGPPGDTHKPAIVTLLHDIHLVSFPKLQFIFILGPIAIYCPVRGPVNIR